MNEQPNFSYINQLSGGDLAFEAKLINIIKEELPKEVEQYLWNLNHKKYQLAANDVHKLKHKISIFGLELSYKLANEYENELKAENISKKDEFLEILNAMINFIEEIK
ncbi:hypothetical protein SAMN04488096_1048 [Mesonia phycicola]|uniref:HPt domain-containing protein n=1 Tax=Mesonia phycicola TaxID=579105 RepID=A0A1M6DIL0_9FLAO|nr:histidine kinase [Mesonia phycicola]SHI72889.1 hypothetical protein SAMN04488096_1048 [Mesonia phycicola]